MAEKDMGLNDKGWERILDGCPEIIEQAERGDIYIIEAKDIKNIGQREPRLMTKFDTSESVAAPLKKHKLNVLPVSRHSYALGRFELYEKFPDMTGIKPEQISLPDLETLKFENLTSESNAINALLASRALGKFLGVGEDDSLFETFNGRMGTDTFSFKVNLAQKKGVVYLPPVTITVDRAQMEIDGGFESSDAVYIMEAKNIRHDDFNMRQLYFPFRKYRAMVKKPVRLVFSQYTNLSYYLYEYAFNDPEDFSSICLVRKKIYTFEDNRISNDDLDELWEETDPEFDDDQNHTDIPFIQADKFDRVVALCEKLESSPDHKLTVQDITDFMATTARQAAYYPAAGEYLGLFDRSEKGTVALTAESLDILTKPYRERQLSFVRLMFRHRIFHILYGELKRSGCMPDKRRAEDIMLQYNVCNEGETSKRRAQTVISWLDWIRRLADEEEE